jgi:hypothetical protein
MNLLFQKYLKLNGWYLYIVNIAIYCIMIFIQYRFIQTDSYYDQYMKPLFHSHEDYVEAVADSRFFELYNYLWVPIHVGIMVLLISLCLFIGYNVLNYAIGFKSCIKATVKSIIIFSLNSLIITSLKAYGVITFNASTVDDDYFIQSLGRFLIPQKYPDIIYSLMEKFNIAELLFCIVLSLMVSRTYPIKFKRSLILTSSIYLASVIIYICFTEFFNFIFTN